MAENAKTPNGASHLRQRAEKAASAQPAHDQDLSPNEAQRLIHELRVHQIELEMQNDELRRVQGELEASRDRYSDLYDFAPVGYLAISEKGLILEANLTVTEMLGVERGRLIGQSLSRFVVAEDEDVLYLHWKQVFQMGERHTCELEMVKAHGASFFAQLESVVFKDREGNCSQWRTTISDITQRERAKEALQEAHDGLEQRVEERTWALKAANKQLEQEIARRAQSEEQLLAYQGQLRSLASELILAEEKERRRIASDLHDQIGQALAVSLLSLGGLEASASSPEVSGRLREVRELIDQAFRDSRSLAFDLSPPILYELGLDAAVEALAQQMQARHGIRIAFEGDEHPKPLDDGVRVLLFQSVRELLFNVIRHAQAGKAKISVHRDQNDIQIEVEDDGVGFDASRVGVSAGRPGGFGLFNLRERLDLLDGRFEIESRPGRGTRARMVAPLKRDADARKGGQA